MIFGIIFIGARCKNDRCKNDLCQSIFNNIYLMLYIWKIYNYIYIERETHIYMYVHTQTHIYIQTHIIALE